MSLSNFLRYIFLHAAVLFLLTDRNIIHTSLFDDGAALLDASMVR